MQTIPLLLKHLDINKINSAFSSFIWASKRPRISLKKLMLIKDKGGLHFPDICKYNLARILKHGLDWLKGTNHYSNIPLESELVAPWSLGVMLYTRFAIISKLLRASLILIDTVATWKTCWGLYKLPFLLSKFIQLGQHPEFPLWKSNSHFRLWESKGIRLTSHLLNTTDGRPHTFIELQNAFGLPPSHFLTYQQVIVFFKMRLANLKIIALSNQFDLLVCSREERHSLSALYLKLRSAEGSPSNTQVFTGWEGDFLTILFHKKF